MGVIRDAIRGAWGRALGCALVPTMLAAAGPAWAQDLLPSGVELGDPGGERRDGFGASVAVDGDTLVVGEPQHDNDPIQNSGRVFVYTRSGSVWVRRATLVSSDRDFVSAFGVSVAIDGDTIVVGATSGNGAATASGVAHVFTGSGGSWTEQAKLIDRDGKFADQFGHAVAVDGDTVVVGTVADRAAPRKAFVFTRSSGTWSRQAVLTMPSGNMSDEFGSAVAVGGDTVVVGARRGHSSALNSGVAYVFTRAGSAWTPAATLSASDARSGAAFGNSVSVSGDSVLVGAPSAAGTQVRTGAAYVFTRTGAAWAEKAKLIETLSAPSDSPLAGLGWSVSLDADTAVVGAPNPTLGPGQVLVHRRSSGVWSQVARFSVENGDVTDGVGLSVALDGATVVAGASGRTVSGVSKGAAYVFTVSRERPPMFLLPGIGGTYATNPHDDGAWTFERGIGPDAIRVDPLAGAYDDIIKTLENVGYVQGETLFVVDYDWRLPPGPIDGSIDGVVSGLSGDSITDTRYEYAVDYFGEAMRRAVAAYEAAHPGASLEEIDVICHSTGGLVARTYLQSAAYGADFDAGTKTLPSIRNLFMIGVPNRGASKPWRVLHNDWAGDPAYVAVLSGIVDRAYEKVIAGETVFGPPQPITLATITGTDGQPDPVLFLEQYVPTLRSLLATYPFLDDGFGAETVNADPNERNELVLDLNDGLDLRATPDPSPFAALCDTTVIYGTNEATPTTVLEDDEPPGCAHFSYDDGLNLASLLLGTPGPDDYCDAAVGSGGDGTVPLVSSMGQFVGDGRVTLMPFTQGVNTLESVGHLPLMFNRDVQSAILDRLGAIFEQEDISTNLHQGAAESLYSSAAIISGSLIGTNVLQLVLDPIDAFVTDGSGRRLGFSEATGPLNEIPGSVWVGGADGFGYVLEPVVEPLRLQVIGRGGAYHLRLAVKSGERTANLVMEGTLDKGETLSPGIELEGDFRNLGIARVTVPKRVKLTARRPSRDVSVKVSIQNRGSTAVTIPDDATLRQLVSVQFESLGDCPAPVPQLAAPPRLPKIIKPGKKLVVRFAVTIDCANDAAKTTRKGAHDDFAVTARLDHTALDGHADAVAADDVAPHVALGRLPGPRKARDKGAGGKLKGKLRGAPLLIDVVR